MKRSLLLLSLLSFLFSTALAWSPSKWTDNLYQQVKTEAEKNFSGLFKGEVKIGSASGPVVGKIILNDVSLPRLGRVRQIILDFNPIAYAFNKGDIIPALTKITAIGGEISIKRDTKGNWNFAPLLAPDPSGSAAAPPFHGLLVLQGCQVNYSDPVGFRGQSTDFHSSLTEVNGQIRIDDKNRLKLDLTARAPQPVRLFGSFDPAKGKYEINFSLDDLDCAKWANYLVPLSEFNVVGGRADVVLRLTPPKKKGWPLKVIGNVTFRSLSGSYQTYRLDGINGHLLLADDVVACTDLSGQLNNIPVTVNGRFSDFVKHKLDFTIKLESADLLALRALTPDLRDLDVNGLVDASIAVNGTLAQPAVKGKVSLTKSAIYQQPLGGEVNFNYQGAQLIGQADLTSLYKGSGLANFSVNFSQAEPQINLGLDFSKLNLAIAAQNSPGVEGLANGQLTLAGPLSNLKGKVSADLTQARIFGQPVKQLSAQLTYRNGYFRVAEMVCSSDTAILLGQGHFGIDLSFNLEAEARGFVLSGRGPFGKMSSRVELFKGSLHGRLDQQFLAAPLKHLFASGEAILVSGEVGEQQFDQARGVVSLGGGRLEVSRLRLEKGRSIISAEGVVSVGAPTDLRISGKQLALEDLKLLDLFLPLEARNLKGEASFEVLVTGNLSTEADLAKPETWLGFNVHGRAWFKQCLIAESVIDRLQATVSWEGQVLSVTNCSLQAPRSNLNLSLHYQPQASLEAHLSGSTDLGLIKAFSGKYGRLNGYLGFHLFLAGPVDNLSGAASLRIERGNFDDIYFDRVTGSLSYVDGNLQITDPFQFHYNQDFYRLSGGATLELTDLPKSLLDLELAVVRADLRSVFRLGDNLRGELIERLTRPPSESRSRLDPTKLALRAPNPFPQSGALLLYSTEKKANYFLKKWDNLSKATKKELTTSTTEKLGGRVTGNLQLSGPVGNLAGTASLEVTTGYFRTFSFDHLAAHLTLKNQKLKIDQGLLTKGVGKTSVKGAIDFTGPLALNIVATGMPVDLLNIISPNDTFRGYFNLNAIISGSLDNPLFSLGAASQDLTLADVDFDQLSLALTKDETRLCLRDFSLVEGEHLSRVAGSLDLTASGRVSLEASIRGDAIGLLNLVNDEVTWLNGDSSLEVKIGGTLAKPKINGSANLVAGKVYVKSLDSEIKALQGQAVIINNQLTFESLSGTWQGKRTRDWPNPLALAGTVDLSRAFGAKGTVDLNLVLSPTHLSVAWPNLYTGSVHVNALKLTGPFAFDLSQGPLLAGQLSLDNAVINLTNAGGANGQAFPLNFDLAVDFSKNVYITMGDVSTLNLSNILMNLEVATDKLAVGGSLASPNLLGKVAIKRGNLNIFNREFQVLTTENQKRFYPYDAEKVRENMANFSGEQGAASALPALDLTASVNVENQEKDASGQFVKKDVVVLAHLKGMIGAPNQAQGLNIALSSFTEDKTKSPAEMLPAAYSEQDLKVMLLPDFIKSLTGVGGSPGTSSSVDTNTVVADYLTSRVQAYLFRNLEREAEQKLGLESLTLEYNLGPKMREAMGVKDLKGFEQKPDWSVGFVKGFFDRLYVDIRYTQGGEQTTVTGQKTLFNYQLTYKLTPIWSIIYYREPISVTDPVSGLAKVTLKAGFSLW